MKKSDEILKILKDYFPNARCELNYGSLFQLLIAVVLSAQCTDKRVNSVTKQLFKNYGTMQKLSKASQDDIEKIIKPLGFFRNKARNIIEISKALINDFDGEVPSQTQQLVKLSGVGNKTASVVRSEGFKIPDIAVDTHITRVSNRLGLAKTVNPDKIAKKLKTIFDEENWREIHLLLVLYGRYFCKARTPMCCQCRLKHLCVYYKNKNCI